MHPLQRLVNLGPKPHGKALSYGVFLLPALCVAYFTYLAAGMQLDDALIYLRYVRNFHEGNGLVYNPSENFNGLTSPLFTALMLLAGFLFSNLQTMMILLSGMFFLAAALLGASVFAKTRLERAVTATVLACFGYFYSTFGMETGLYLLLIAASLLLYRRESPWFVITLALLVITRNEGVFLALVLATDYLYRQRRLPPWRYLLAACAVFVIPFLFNLYYYGALLPATGSAKIAQGRSGLWGESWIFLNASYLRDAFFSGSLFAPTFFFCAAVGGLFVKRKQRGAWLSLSFLVLLLAFYVGLNIPNYHWYYAPFLFFLIIFACRGIWQFGEYALAKGHRTTQAMLLALLLIGALVSVQKIVSFEVRGATQSYVDMGVWLRDNTPVTASVAMVEIGTVGWYSQRPIVDILGLVSPYNSAYIGERHFMHWLLHYQPEFILRHEPVWAHEQSVITLEEHGLYTARGDVDISGLVLLERKASNLEVKDLANTIIRRNWPFEEMLRNSDADPSLVALQGSSLFAHAPSTLHLTLEYPVSSIGLGFGIRDTAQGLHGRLCFAVRRAANREVLFKHCIDAGAAHDAMHVEQAIQQSLQAGEELLFDISCVETCNYAWTYWSQVALDEKQQ